MLLCVKAGQIMCSSAGDIGKTTVLSHSFSLDDGGEVTATVLCGEDVAAVIGRIATTRRTRMDSGKKVWQLAFALATKLEEAHYDLPAVLDAGTKEARPRVLKTAGLYSRRSSEHLKKSEFKLAVADLLRALMRPGQDWRSMKNAGNADQEQLTIMQLTEEKLLNILDDHLKQCKALSQASKEDGDITELFEDLEIEDSGMDNR